MNDMDFRKMYEEKLVSAEQAAAVVKSGDWVDYGWTTGTPVAVDAALAKRLPELHDVISAAASFSGFRRFSRSRTRRST